MACKTNLWASADTHGRFERFTLENFPEQAKMTRDNLVIICGDFGGVWDRDKSVIMQRFKRSGTMEAVPLRTLTGCACDNGSSIRSALILQEQLTSQRGRAGGEIESLVSGGKSHGKTAAAQRSYCGLCSVTLFPGSPGSGIQNRLNLRRWDAAQKTSRSTPSSPH